MKMSLKTTSCNVAEALDIIDAYQEDADSCSASQIADYFPVQFRVSKKTALTESFQNSNTFVKLSANSVQQTLAASNKHGHIILIDTANGTIISTIEAHSQEVTAFSFCKVNSNLLYSCSSDGTMKLWDLRNNDAVRSFSYSDEEGSKKSYTCLDINCTGEFLCCGTSLLHDEDAYLMFWDVRNENKLLGGYWESHSDDITQVKFHPAKRQQLVSAAMDNLINVYDISKKSEDAALWQCINYETTPDEIHWDHHSAFSSKLFAISHPQLVQYWDIEDTVPIADLNAKSMCSAIKRQNPDQCHFISLNFDKENNPLIMLSSNLGYENQPNPCIRTVSYSRGKMLKPHATFELKSNKALQVYDSIYLQQSEVYVTLENTCLRYWSTSTKKRQTHTDSSGGCSSANKKHKFQ